MRLFNKRIPSQRKRGDETLSSGSAADADAVILTVRRLTAVMNWCHVSSGRRRIALEGGGEKIGSDRALCG